MLKNHYTIKEVSEGVKVICSYNWRRIYTTNYDNSISFSFNQQNKYIDCLTLEDSPQEFYKNHNNVIQINGNIAKLNKETLNNSFKLTRSSYVSKNSFENSNWYYPFKKDLEICNAIIFIGYSLYDIEIEKILFNGNYKEKTFFITLPDISNKDKYILEKYGIVLALGLESFANELNYFDPSRINTNFHSLFCLDLYKSQDTNKPIDDLQINNFFLHGDLETHYIDHFITGNPEVPYLIMRDKLNEICSSLKKNQSIVIYSDFGNGKSVIQDLIKSILTIEGLNVYSVNLDDIKCFEKDFENILGNKKQSIICIDGYSKYLDILDYISKIKSDKITLCLTERTNNHQHFRNELSKKIEFYEYNTDILVKDSEVIRLIEIIDNLGYWKEKINWGIKRKKNYILDDCKRQISNVLLDVFNSPQMLNKTKEILKELLNQDSFKKTVFAICLVEILGYQCTDSLISSIAGNPTCQDSCRLK